MRTILRFVAGASLAVMIPVLVGACLSPSEAWANAVPVVTNCFVQCKCLEQVNNPGVFDCTANTLTGCDTLCMCYWTDPPYGPKLRKCKAVPPPG